MLEGRQLPFARDLPVRFVRCESVPVACRDHFEMSLAAGSRQSIRLSASRNRRMRSAGPLAGISPSKQAVLAQALTAEWMHAGSCSCTEPTTAGRLGPLELVWSGG